MRTCIILPCHNEEKTIARVVRDFQTVLPDSTVYVYDNGSTDNTAQTASEAGAIVRQEPRIGKGNIVRRMFADVEADIYIMVDGDGTYDAGAAPHMIEHLVGDNLDMVIGRRVHESADAYRRGHRLGNRLLTGLVASIFQSNIKDMLSGYRVLSRRLVKSFPATSRNFEIETELTIHTLQLRLPVREIDTRYHARADNTQSKLSTYKDGFRILNFILFFFKELRPFLFFSLTALVLALLSLGLAMPVVLEFLETGLVPRFPTAFLSMGIMLSALLSFVCGIILDSISRGRLENKYLAYLRYQAPGEQNDCGI